MHPVAMDRPPVMRRAPLVRPQTLGTRRMSPDYQEEGPYNQDINVKSSAFQHIHRRVGTQPQSPPKQRLNSALDKHHSALNVHTVQRLDKNQSINNDQHSRS